MPFLVVGVQFFIFFSVESVEMKFALASVFLFQVWQKSRARKTDGTNGEDGQSEAAEAGGSKQKQKKTK